MATYITRPSLANVNRTLTLHDVLLWWRLASKCPPPLPEQPHTSTLTSNPYTLTSSLFTLTTNHRLFSWPLVPHSTSVRDRLLTTHTHTHTHDLHPFSLLSIHTLTRTWTAQEWTLLFLRTAHRAKKGGGNRQFIKNLIIMRYCAISNRLYCNLTLIIPMVT